MILPLMRNPQFLPMVVPNALQQSIRLWQRLPVTWRYQMVTSLLNQMFKPVMTQGELEHLIGKTVAIELTEPSIEYVFVINQTGFAAANRAGDVCIKSSLKSFIALASQQQDPDALFFNRQLTISGDVDLSLEIKHLIDNVHVPQLLKQALERLYAQL